MPTETALNNNQLEDLYRREVRLGLVLFGGVSLAIYMNGVSFEFFRAVRGRGLYGFLKEITDSQIVVDIVSGTSAGGINGIFLAHALANELEFGVSSDLWRKQGALGKLLHGPFDGPLDSVMNSTGYYMPKLRDAFGEMSKKRSLEDLRAARPCEIDLFVTGTDFYGEAHTEFDDGGHSIDVMEHRTLFKLKHRPHREGQLRSDFLPDDKTAAALGKLAAITSSFPVAFAPIAITPAPEDDLLRKWGLLYGSKFFIDGGVLANKPFTPTVKAIFNRSTERQVDRYLCYVEPDPEVFMHDPPSTAPSVVRVAFDSLSTLPRYQSISGDLQEVALHNSRAEQYRRMCRAAVGQRPDTTTSLYKKARLLSISDRALLGIFRTNSRDPLLSRDAKEAGARMVNCFEDTVAASPESDRLLHDFDIYFRRRRLFHLSYWIYKTLYPGSDAGQEEERLKVDKQELQKIWFKVNRFNQLLEILQYQIESLVDRFDFCWEDSFKNASEDARTEASDLWHKVARLFRYLLRADGIAFPDPADCTALSKLNKDLGDRVEALTRKLPAENPSKWKGLLETSDEAEKTFFESLPDSFEKLCLEYSEFEKLDSLLFPAELVSGLVSRDIIRTIRFSPSDATIGACNLKPKVLGGQFGAFGGFFKQDWRSNDILFGRLDGACQLAELLLGECASARKRTPEEAAEVEARFLDEQGRFREGWAPADFFPNCDPCAIESTFRAAVRGCWTRQVIDTLVNAAHNEIFIDDSRERSGPEGERYAKDILKQYGTLREYLRAGYSVRTESAINVARPSALPVIAKVAAAIFFVGVGLLVRPRRRS